MPHLVSDNRIPVPEKWDDLAPLSANERGFLLPGEPYPQRVKRELRPAHNEKPRRMSSGAKGLSSGKSAFGSRLSCHTGARAR